MLDTEELLVFTRIVATQSLARAATELRLPRATVSRRLAGLEAKLGVRLLARTTRSMAVTDAGRELLRHAHLVVDAAIAAEASVRRRDDDIRGDVRVSLGRASAAALADVLADFIVAHPTVRLLVHVSDRSVDLQRDGIDVAIRASAKIAPGLVARRLAPARLVAAAAPSYLARYGAPTSLRDLKEHRCLLGLDARMKPRTHWPAGKRTVAVRGAVHSDDPHLLTQLCVRGLGIALLPNRLADPHIQRGELAVVLADRLRVDGAIFLVYGERTMMPPQLRAFVDWIRARAPAVLRARGEAA
ncbi:LysR family transcriptional regulator [Pendulispora albinea]|uniref:LysR family transcriptional regulator n=1 Tax=Pendulispora albinea TaxID=2741071 RepID=A0ABZ2MCF1_9BACT